MFCDGAFCPLGFCCVVWFQWEADGPVSVYRMCVLSTRHLQQCTPLSIERRSHSSCFLSRLFLLDRQWDKKENQVLFISNPRQNGDLHEVFWTELCNKTLLWVPKVTEICLNSWTCDFRRKHLVTLTHTDSGVKKKQKNKTPSNAHSCQTHQEKC